MRRLFCVVAVPLALACTQCQTNELTVKCGEYIDLANMQSPCGDSVCVQRITTDANCVFNYEWTGDSIKDLTASASLTTVQFHSIDVMYNSSTLDIYLSATRNQRQDYSWTSEVVYEASYANMNTNGFYPDFKVRLLSMSNVQIDVVRYDVSSSQCAFPVNDSDGLTYCTVGSSDCRFESATCTYQITLDNTNSAWEKHYYHPQVRFLPNNDSICYADVGISAVLYDGDEARANNLIAKFVTCSDTTTYTASGKSLLFVLSRNQSNIEIMPYFIVSTEIRTRIGWAVYVVLSLFILATIVLAVLCIRHWKRSKQEIKRTVSADGGPAEHKWSY